jgi:predicted nucleic acid-binding protein
MMNVLFDTNVLLDVLAERHPHYRDSARVWSLAEQGRIRGLVSVISFNNVYYIVRKVRDRKTADKVLGLLRDIFTPVPLDGQILNQAIASGFKDFEDAIQWHSALHAVAACIVSRNPNHFPASGLPVMSPAEFLTIYSFK